MIRVFLLVAAVVIGGLVIANAFPSAGGPFPRSSPTASHGGHGPSPSPSKTKHHLSCPPHKGIRVAVENATSTAGLAAKTVGRLKPGGYTINVSTDVGNATTNATTTTIYYRSAADKVAALCMKNKYFKIATVAKLPAGATATPAIAPAVNLAVFLGSDYAAANPVA